MERGRGREQRGGSLALAGMRRIYWGRYAGSIAFGELLEASRLPLGIEAAFRFSVAVEREE